MKCPHCETENPPAARFCMNCGTALTQRCPDCQAELPAGARFCIHCGRPVRAEPEAAQRAHAVFDETGPVPLSGERRLVTVILADAKGSTALAEQIGTEAWVEIMNGAFQILGSEIYRYGGEIDQFRGDGLVAFFGATTAHEDDPERAVLAALAMQEAIKRYAPGLTRGDGADPPPGAASGRPPDAGVPPDRLRPLELRMRVGVNTGEVIAIRVGDRHQHSENTAMGQAIALAARMEAAAKPGTVLVSENTYRLVAPLFEWENLGEITVKGVSQPVAVHRPLARKALRGKGRGIAGLESPLVGRQAELRALREAIERLRAGMGGIVTLVGEAGIGKSRLVAEIRKLVLSVSEGSANPQLATRNTQLATRNLQWIEGRCLSYTAAIAYQLWLDMLRGFLGIAPDAPLAAVSDALQEWVHALCPECFDDVFPYLTRLMSLPLTTEQEAILHSLGAEGLQARTLGALETLIEHATRQQPLVIVCEDLHWADPTSLDLLERLLALTDRTPLLLICVFRPQTEHGCWRIMETAARLYRHRHTDLRLDPLSAAESEMLVTNLLRSVPILTGGTARWPADNLRSELKARILSRGEGNPFYVEEILRSLIERGDIVCDEVTCRWEAAPDVDEIVIPETLHGVLMARIDRLPQETKRILQLASVIGQIFSYRVLAAIVQDCTLSQTGKGQRIGELDDHLVILQREQMIRKRARKPEREYIFEHQLTLEAAYNSLLRRERRSVHRQVAAVLERLYPDRTEEQVKLLAYHRERAGEPEKANVHLL
jgi:class 3 adenylate cyclase